MRQKWWSSNTICSVPTASHKTLSLNAVSGTFIILALLYVVGGIILLGEVVYCKLRSKTIANRTLSLDSDTQSKTESEEMQAATNLGFEPDHSLPVLNELKLLINDPNSNLDVGTLSQHASQLYDCTEKDLNEMNQKMERILNENQSITSSIDRLLKDRLSNLGKAVQDKHVEMLYDLSEVQNMLSKTTIENQRLQHYCYNYDIAEKKIKAEMKVMMQQRPMLESKIKDESFNIRKVENDIQNSLRNQEMAKETLAKEKEKYENLMRILKSEELEIESDLKAAEKKLFAAEKHYEECVSLAYTLRKETEQAQKDKLEAEISEGKLQNLLHQLQEENVSVMGEADSCQNRLSSMQSELDTNAIILKRTLRILHTRKNGLLDEEESKARIKVTLQEGKTFAAKTLLKSRETEFQAKMQSIEQMDREKTEYEKKMNRLGEREKEATQMFDSIQDEYRAVAKEHGRVTVEYEQAKKKAQTEEQKVRAALEAIQMKVDEEIALRETIMMQIRMTIAELEQAKAEELSERSRLEGYAVELENYAKNAEKEYQETLVIFQKLSDQITETRENYEKTKLDWIKENESKLAEIDSLKSEIAIGLEKSKSIKKELKDLVADTKLLTERKNMLLKDIDLVVKKKISCEKNVNKLEQGLFHFELEVSDLEIMTARIKQAIDASWKKKHETSEINKNILKLRWKAKQTCLDRLRKVMTMNDLKSKKYETDLESKFSLCSNFFAYKDFLNMTKYMLTDMQELLKFTEIFSFNQSFYEEMQDKLMKSDFLRIRNAFDKGDFRILAICDMLTDNRKWSRLDAENCQTDKL
ncbi:hypothetical protein Ciccas_011072 [Cichlidogyrus casuarinus]|uniref:Uncharacterized protein n=1 Tax=Cichlidogyrus casuarinus TaxID=1844966 RepID=A0ABD2PSB6_9PLAT